MHTLFDSINSSRKDGTLMAKTASLITTPRASKTMDLTFGLMRVAVAWAPLFRGDTEKIKGHKHCAEHHGQLRQAWYCEHGEHYPSGVETAFEYAGVSTVLSEDELSALEADSDGAIKLTRSVAAEDIDPSYFEKAYILWPTPSRTNEQVFLAVLAAMRLTKLALVGEFVVSKSTRLLVIRWSEEHGTLIAHVCNYAANMKAGDVANVAAGKQAWNAPPAELVGQAATLLKTMKADFDPGEVEDSYQQALAAALHAKASGTAAPAQEAGEDVSDLMGMLKASIEAAKAA